jgi:Flp pilus assembly protein TadG
MSHSGWRLAARLRSMRARRIDGVAAIEFALVAPPFLVLLLGIFEAGLVFFAGATLQAAVDVASRHIRTNDLAVTAQTSPTVFRNVICDNAPFLTCTGIQIDIETRPDFSTASFSSPLTKDGKLDPKLSQSAPVAACQVVLVRAFYEWPTFTPMLSLLLGNLSDGNHLLVGTAAFRAEPFDTTKAAGC